MSIKFSIIMPCFNSKDYIIHAIESVIHQTYDNWELIAVNDGSTDTTSDILTKYAYIDNRIKVYSKDNGGYCTAVNTGLDKIVGDYFLVMGSDDKLANDLLSKIVSCISDDLPDMVLFNTSIYKNGMYIGRDKLTAIDRSQFIIANSINEFETKYPDISKIIFYRDTSRCYKSSLLKNLRYFGRYGIDADEIFSIMFARNCRCWLCVPYDGYIWNVRDDSVSRSKTSIQKYEDIYQNWLKYYSAASERKWNLCNKEKLYCARWIRAAKAICKKQRDINSIYRYIQPIRKAVKELTLLPTLSVGNRLFLLFPVLSEYAGILTGRYDF